MKSVLWFLIGIIGGFVAAHILNKDPRGHDLLADIDARIMEFTDRVGDAYRSQEAKFTDVAGDVRDAASDVFETVKGAASDAVDAASDAAKKLTD